MVFKISKIIVLLILVSFFVPICLALDYEIDQNAVIKCQGDGSATTFEFLSCYKRLTGFEYPQYIEMNYGDYLMERCNPSAYALSYESITCMLKHKQIYFEYHNILDEKEESIILDELKFVESQKNTCLEKGNQFRFFCSNYDTYLRELSMYKNLPGYLGIGMGLPDLTKVKKDRLISYFGFYDIINIEKKSDNEYLIQAKIERKLFGLFNRVIDVNIVFNIEQLNQEIIKKWWHFFYKDI